MRHGLVDSVFSTASGFFSDRRGVSTTIIAIALPGLIGFAALGTETGLWYTVKLQNQSAADAAAISAAYEVIAGRSNVTGDLIPAASEAAAQNGYTGSIPTVVYPYTDGLISNGVAVTLQKTQSSMLAAMYLPSVNIANKAVAVIETQTNPCILALGTSGTGVEIAASTELDMPNCSIAANSNGTTAIELNASTSTIVAATLVAVGEVSMNLNPINPAAPPSEFSLGSPARIGAPTMADPYAGTLTHTFLTTGMTGQCGRAKSASLIVYNTGNCVIPELTIRAGEKVDLSPGTYWITGNLTVASGGLIECSKCDNTNGIGVTIILPAYAGKIGAASMTNALFNLNAPSVGQFAGIVMAQDANGLPPGTTYLSSNSSIAGAAGATLNGLVYFPKSSMTFNGNPSVTGPKCLLLVVNWLNVDANSNVDSTGCTVAGLANLPAVSTVALAE